MLCGKGKADSVDLPLSVDVRGFSSFDTTRGAVDSAFARPVTLMFAEQNPHPSTVGG
jgi:hypothetical protein